MRRALLFFVLGAVVVAAGLIGLSLYSARPPETEVIAVPTQSTTKGSPAAPVTIIEFADFQCSHCADFASGTLKRLEREYIATGKVKLIFRHFPVLGQESVWAAIGAECASQQGKFWAFHDLLFRARKGVDSGAFRPARLLTYAKELGLDEEAFRACLQGGQVAEKVRADIQEGVKYGVEGTPSFVIQGRLIVGNQPYDVFKEAIEEALSQSK
ncbi:MAG: DsbA family protein [Armatimonadota bacterium]|nr:DsbA family protein [Armatimonadota bacterium]